MSIFSEAMRRHVFRVGAAYLVVAWLLLQIADVLLPALQLPEWTVTFVAVLLVLGFPLTLVLAWAYDIVPGGVKRTEPLPADKGKPQGPSRTVDFVIIGVLTLALGFVTFNYVLVDDSEPEAAALDMRFADPATAEESIRLPNSVAVLPLENLSPEPDNAYIAAGMHEEILNHLAQISALSVISRTSVMTYEDSELLLPQIAAELNVETILEGSLRFANDQVRVTLQLIDPRTDAHLWSEAYNGDLSDVFEFQADIAMNVANAMEVAFSLEEQQSIESVPTENAVAIALYLRAADAWGRRELETAIADLDQAISLDPEFAAAYALKARLIAVAAPPTEDVERVIIESANRALELDPTLGQAHLALGILHESRWRASDALASLQRAYDLNPGDPRILIEYARFNRYTGDYERAVEVNRRAIELDPLSRSPYTQLGASLHALGNFDEAAESFEKGIELQPTFGVTYSQAAALEARRGRVEDALRYLETAEALLTPVNALRGAQMAASYARVDRPDDAQRMFDRIATVDREVQQSDVIWTIAYLAIGENDEAHTRLTNAVENQIPEGLFSYGETRIPFTNLKSNLWGLDALEEPRFVELRDRIFALD